MFNLAGYEFPCSVFNRWVSSHLQVSFVAPPKHDPVVIKLGEDSDTDESDASDTEADKKTASKGKSSGGGGLFGGLEMMIKEARKSAEVT